MFRNLYHAVKKFGIGIALLTITGNDVFAQQWEDVGGLTTVSAGGSSFNNLVINPAGKYFLSYYDLSVSKGSVQIFDGNSWYYAGGSAGITSGYATYNSLSLAPNGNMYYTNQGSGLEVREFNGSSWSQLPSATTSITNYQASAVSPSNVLFTYGSYGSGTVKRYVNGTWEQVGNAGFSNGAEFAEMVIGSNNMVYTSNVSGGLRVYQNATTASASDTWTLVGGSIVDAASSGEQYSSDMAIDTNNNLYVAYVSPTASGKMLNVRKFDGTSWIQIGNANFSGGKVQHVAIAVTSAGVPYVVASRWENDNFLQNTVYKLDLSTNTWGTFGSDFISDGQATYNDLAVDNMNNYLVLAYSQNGTKVKRISLGNTASLCNNTDPGNNPGDTGCITFNYKGQAVTYATVRGQDGKIWLQQNLGSTQVATSMADADSYGDLFQWGRWDDGHQVRTSPTTTVPSNNNPAGLAGITSFILGTGPAWWSTNATSDKWSAENSSSITAEVGADPCRIIGQGWRLPSQADWVSAVNAEGMSNAATAFASRLKLPAAGYRSQISGGFTYVGERGYYWSSDVANSGGKYLYNSTGLANPNSGGPRAQGQSVRCIKDLTALAAHDITFKNKVGVYPNPTNGILNIKADSLIDSVNITNTVGQNVNVQFFNNQINMQGIPNGLYIVEIMLKNGQKISKKIIKN